METSINRDYLLEKLAEIIDIPSPSGYCKNVVNACEGYVRDLGFKFWRNQKGNGHIEVEGQDNSYCVGVFVHIDTLGAMVRSVNSDGTLRMTAIGGSIFPTLDGEYCKVHTREGKVYTGTILSLSPATHVFKDASTRPRDVDNMMVKLDEEVRSKAETLALGVGAGDFISVEPKFTITEKGYIKSRYLDDKASTACVLAMLEMYRRTGIKPKYKTIFVLSTFEEIGHGAASIPGEMNEVIAFDMGCVGADLDGDETKVSICPKDSSGPYDYGMTSRLIEICKAKGLDYAVDIFPMYGSDASASLRGGNDVKAALIGPGVANSHGMERTHVKGLENSIKLMWAYLNE